MKNILKSYATNMFLTTGSLKFDFPDRLKPALLTQLKELACSQQDFVANAIGISPTKWHSESEVFKLMRLTAPQIRTKLKDVDNNTIIEIIEQREKIVALASMPETENMLPYLIIEYLRGNYTKRITLKNRDIQLLTLFDKELDVSIEILESLLPSFESKNTKTPYVYSDTVFVPDVSLINKRQLTQDIKDIMNGAILNPLHNSLAKIMKTVNTRGIHKVVNSDLVIREDVKMIIAMIATGKLENINTPLNEIGYELPKMLTAFDSEFDAFTYELSSYDEEVMGIVKLPSAESQAVFVRMQKDAFKKVWESGYDLKIVKRVAPFANAIKSIGEQVPSINGVALINVLYPGKKYATMQTTDLTLSNIV